jgi:hypothetical protein
MEMQPEKEEQERNFKSREFAGVTFMPWKVNFQTLQFRLIEDIFFSRSLGIRV